MKKQLFAATAFIACMALWASSCVKESSTGENVRPAGTKISFSVTTGYETGNGTRAIFNETRTVYSGSVTNSIERIDWVSGDKIKIRYLNGASSGSLSEVGWGNYSVNDISNENASILHAGGTDNGTDLEWGANSQNKFYGVYPSSADLTSAGVVTGTIPATQTLTYSNGKYLPQMDCAYMVAYADNDQISNGVVTLPFTPVVTAYEFKLRLDSESDWPSLGISAIQLKASGSGEYLSGGFSAEISDYDNGVVTWDNADATGSNGTTITALIPTGNGNPDLSKTTDLDFTVFALPMDISQLTLRIKYTDNTVKSIPLKKGNTWVPFAAGQKHVISNYNVPNLDYTYIITSINPITLGTGHDGGTRTISVQSYKQDKTDANNKKPVPWKMQYSTDNGETWSDLTSTGNNAGSATDLNNDTWSANAISGSGASLNNGSLSNEPSTLTMPGTNSREAHIDPAGLDAVTPVGLTTRVDLSLNGTGGARNTANCYIVTGPGHYMFPCVYGNGIRNGSQNYSAFWPFLALDSTSDAVSDNDSNVSVLSNVQTVYNTNSYSANYYTPALFNALGEPVSGPITGQGGTAATNPEYIIDDLGQYGTVSASAAVLWQDVPQGDEIIPYDNQHVGITIVNNKHFIWFNIDADSIKPGNVVIALRGTIFGHYSKSEVFWSWHIWIPEDAVTDNNSFMNRNLGQVSQTKVTKYADRSLTFRIATVEEDGQGNPMATEEFTFSQNGDSSNESIDRNTYYQWGRKDPMLNTNSDAYVSFNPTIFDVGSNNGNLRDPDDCFTTFQSFNGVAKGVTGFDRSRGIRAPFYLLKNNSTDSWLDGAVYPNYSSGTLQTTYTIKTGHEQSRYFSESDVIALTGSSFNPSGTSWLQYYQVNANSANNTVWTEAEVNLMEGSPYNFPSDFFEDWGLGQYNGTNWYRFVVGTVMNQNHINIMAGLSQNGQINAIYTSIFFQQVTKLGYRLVYPTGQYPYGPHGQGVYDSLIESDLFSSTDFSSTSSYVYGPAYTAVDRSESSIPYNLWNSYLYSEDPSCTNAELHDDNKFKTIYDPCPPGYTVPTKNELSVSEYPERGSLPSSTSVNGYWTDHPLMIDMINSSGNQADISNFQYFNQAYMKIVGGSEATGASRGTAASIRPMVDPKYGNQ